MKFEAVPILELSDADVANARVISHDEAAQLLFRKVNFGVRLSGTIAVLSGAGAVWAIVSAQSGPWAITGFVMAILFGTASMLAGKKVELAARIAAEPGVVFWIHPTELRQTTLFGAKTTNFITLHTTTSGNFEVAMERADMLAIAAWVKRHNPAVRFGAYEQPEH
jgi:hypothetical protein